MESASRQAPYRGIVVSHTHWDRAWYLPFQTLRLRLVRLVDRLLDLLENEPRFRAFTLDGQTVLLEDYLEIRPENEDRLCALVTGGRLPIGPWYTLPDLFLVSGEAVIRNLQRGRALARHFGGGMDVGYIPDPFGHFAQMPQILRGFGLDTYLFMRGMSQEMKDDLGAVFDWRAPDGSTVTAVYQRLGYFPVAALGHPDVFGRFDGHAPELPLARERMAEAITKLLPEHGHRTILLSSGFDHMPEEPDLPDLLDALGAEMSSVLLEHGTLPDFADALRQEDAPRQSYEGDLLGNADHPILLSVYSARGYLKQQNHRAQHLLTRIAEPLSAWMAAQALGEDARAFLDHAWKLLLRNHPHDDLCGCSADAVHRDDERRFKQVEQIADALLVEHLEHLLKKGFAPPPIEQEGIDVWVFNPHPFAQRMAVETSVYCPNPDSDAEAPNPERRLAGYDADGQAIAVTTLRSEARAARVQFLEKTWARRYDIAFDVDLPPLGYQLVRLVPDGPPKSADHTDRPLVLENAHYGVAAEDGRLTLTEKETGATFEDLLRFEYQLDAGDTYSFGPVPAYGPWWAACTDAAWHPRCADTLRLTHRLSVPVGYDRAEEQPQGETTLRLATDVRLTPQRGIAFSVRYENTARNGRLRAVLPVGFAARTALADGHFRLAERAAKPAPQTPEDVPERYAAYPGELDYPTHHQGDFVLMENEDRRVWIANRGLPEFELLNLEGDTHIAVTLHRAVDLLSVEGGRIRRCQAGPTLPVPEAQCLRPVRAELAFGVGDCSRMEAARHARPFAHPAWAREMPHLPYVSGNGPLPRRASLLEIDNPAVAFSALRPAGEKTRVLRLYNLTGEPQDTRVTLGIPAAAWCPATLAETWDTDAAQPVKEATLQLTLRPHQIQTLLLR